MRRVLTKLLPGQTAYTRRLREAEAQPEKLTMPTRHEHIEALAGSIHRQELTGAVIVLKQWYDNTSNNPNNPDPDQWVVGGSRTGDEMTHNWMAVTHLDDEGYNELIDKRETK